MAQTSTKSRSSKSAGRRAGGSGASSKRSTGKSQGSSRSNGGARAQTRESKQPQSRAQAPSGQSEKNREPRGSSGSGEGQQYLHKFFCDQLKDIYYAEQKLVQALARMRDAATTEELRDAFEDHLHQTERHARRLEKVFENMGMRPEGKRCEAIEGIIREVEEIIEETEEGSITRDAALIMGAQKAEHYEIATYGGLVTFAITMGLYEEADLLDKTLIEEEITDALLTDVAEEYINIEAELESQEAEGEGQEEREGSGEEEAEEPEAGTGTGDGSDVED